MVRQKLKELIQMKLKNKKKNIMSNKLTDHQLNKF